MQIGLKINGFPVMYSYNIPFVTEKFYELIRVFCMNRNYFLRAEQLKELRHPLHIAMSACMQILEVVTNCFCQRWAVDLPNSTAASSTYASNSNEAFVCQIILAMGISHKAFCPVLRL